MTDVTLSGDQAHAYGAAFLSDAVTSFDRVACTEHPFTDGQAWVNPALDWTFCHDVMNGFADAPSDRT